MANEVTRFQSPVLVGGAVAAITAGLVSAMVAGSIHTTAIYTDRAQSTTQTLSVGTGSYQVYTDAVCVNTGGLAKYNSCYIANPLSGTASIMRTQLDTNKAPNASPATCVTTPIGNTTGTASTLIRYFITASGSTFWTASGTLTGQQTNATSPRILPGAGIRCWHSTTPGIGLKEQLRLWVSKQYIP